MANNFFISYDLVGPDRDYEAVEEVIQKAGTARKVLVNFWYISTVLSSDLVKKRLEKVLEKDDKLVIVIASNAKGINIQSYLEFMQKYWKV